MAGTEFLHMINDIVIQVGQVSIVLCLDEITQVATGTDILDQFAASLASTASIRSGIAAKAAPAFASISICTMMNQFSLAPP